MSGARPRSGAVPRCSSAYCCSCTARGIAPMTTSPPLYDPMTRGGRSRRRKHSDPKAKIRVLNTILEEVTDKSSDNYQRTAWMMLQRSIYNLLNKINSECDVWKFSKKLLQLNILRGRGIFCRLIMDDKLYSNRITCHFAALVSLINAQFPVIGDLLLTRLISQFKRAVQQNDKNQSLTSVAFIAHLTNQNVVHTNLTFEIVQFLLNSPTEDSMEIIFMIWNICGYKVGNSNKKKMNAIIDAMKNLLRDKRLDSETLCMIKITLKMIRTNKHSSQEFYTVLKSNKHTHIFYLNEVLDSQNHLDYYHFDSEYEANEYLYKLFCKQILEIKNEEYILIYDIDEKIDYNKGNLLKMDFNLILLKRTLNNIVNTLCDYENSALKLVDTKLRQDQELDVCFILLNFCCEHKIYNESLGHATQILCQLNKSLVEPLEDIFIETYATVHEFDKIKLRNIAKFFAHLLFTDTISWMVLSTIQLNETDTTHSSRMYIKILFHELVEHMGIDMLSDRVQDTFLKEAFEGIFLGDNQHNSKFAIDFFISIGLDDLIDKFRSSIVFKLKKVSTSTEVNDC